MLEDVRDKLQLGHEDVLALNFIRDTGTYFYRRHYRAGLRSHIMEVVDPADVKKEKQGIMIGGLMRFPRARPMRMLRIFRTRFPSLKEALDESRRVKIVERYLVPDHLARSDEFLVDYRLHGKHELLLCGLQAYVEGEILDPWRHLDERYLLLLSERMGIMSVGDPQTAGAEWVKRTVREAVSFIGKIREMIAKADHVPDLAGVGNLILTPSGKI